MENCIVEIASITQKEVCQFTFLLGLILFEKDKGQEEEYTPCFKLAVHQFS